MHEVCYDRFDDDEKCKCYSIIGQYFSNTISVHELNSRNIVRQPIAHSTVAVWFPDTVINKRRVTEASNALINAGLFHEAIDELCNLENICAYIKAGRGYSLIQNLNRLIAEIKKIPNWKYISSRKRETSIHYARWLKQEMTLLMLDPASQITATATAQPVISQVRIDMMNLLQYTKLNSCYIGNSSSWHRARTFGIKSDFTYLIAYLHGHCHGVHCVSANKQNDSIVASCSMDGVKIWNIDSFEEKGFLRGHTGVVLCVTFHPVAPTIASGGEDYSILIWDIESQSIIKTIKRHTSKITMLNYNTDGSRLVSAAHEGQFIIWKVSDYELEEINCIQVKYAINSVQFNSSGSHFIAGDSYWNCSYWSSSNFVVEKQLKQLNDKEEEQWTVTIKDDPFMDFDPKCPSIFHPSKSNIIATAKKCIIVIWDLSSDKTKQLEAHTSFINALSFTPSGQRLVSSSHHYPKREDHSSVRVWNSSTGELLLSLFGGTDGVNSICFGHDSKLITGSWDMKVKIYDGSSWDKISKPEKIFEERHTSWCCQVRFSPDGQLLASCSEDSSAKIWDIKTGREILHLAGHKGRCNSISWKSDGKFIATSSLDCSFKIWSLETGAEVKSVVQHSEFVRTIHWGDDDKFIASGSYDKTAKIYDTENDTVIAVLNGHTDYVMSIMLHRNGIHVATGSKDCSIRIWNILTQAELFCISSHTELIWEILYSPNYLMLASASMDKTVRIFETSTYKEIVKLQHNENVNCCAFSHDSKTLFSGSSDMLITIWDITTSQKIKSFCGHSHSVDTLSVNSDSLLVSGSEDTTLKIWDAVNYN